MERGMEGWAQPWKAGNWGGHLPEFEPKLDFMLGLKKIRGGFGYRSNRNDSLPSLALVNDASRETGEGRGSTLNVLDEG